MPYGVALEADICGIVRRDARLPSIVCRSSIGCEHGIFELWTLRVRAHLGVDTFCRCEELRRGWGYLREQVTWSTVWIDALLCGVCWIMVLSTKLTLAR